MKKQYTLTIDEELVEEAQTYYTEFGGKLSPLINVLLTDWVTKQKDKKK